jgi:hypothetical protein
MSREVALRVSRRPAPLAVIGSVMLWCISCSGSMSSAIAVDAPTVEYIPVDGGMVDGSSTATCGLVQISSVSSSSCRADWSCPRLGIYSFACGQLDGGGVECYCRLNRDVQKFGVIDSCGIGPDAVVSAGELFCGWTFLSPGVDGGLQPVDGGAQPSDGGGAQ